MSNSPSADRASGRHRKSRTAGPVLRRVAVIAVTAPVAGTILFGTSAFAAEQAAPKTLAKTDTVTLDTAEQAIANNLDTRVQDVRLGSTFSGVVIDAQSTAAIWGHDATTALMPASNTKLATSTAALTILGPDHRFTTKAVYDNGTLTLVGGGDRTLTTADLTAMATTAVAGLKSAGLTSVKVAVDDSLFPEPTLATGWNSGYYPDSIAPVRALVVDGRHVTDTSLDAGQIFAKLVAKQGVTVTGTVAHATAATSAVPVAQHESAALSAVVEHMLKVSDNDIAETLLRMTALAAGRPATFEDGTAVVRQVLTQYGVSLANFEVYDGSGLSRSNRIPAQTIADILHLADDPANAPILKYIVEGLPVSGEAGSTLGPEWGRFDTADSKCAVGKVSAKTGTLTGAIALSGLTVAADGRWKIFSFIENNSTAAPDATKDALDGLAATVNGCWA
ncbi:D-alanyl-D-alanine carboxypeptidase/D-alanyl-D-alanine-endopeptidase [Streptomyces sp. MBT65]|uniref:D-alanyl-D-alanine carboxypeptidase/D-alanyl-D-alanine endopeptidase n=1 Tax=Streptomyces sp. MBT65 TaxID=1488395 RepID=UPI00190D175E|nr:D-alanyl-D-alanine carboxypeptidase/D-alanyl-D-alanine-endopeptidase [Streptomyces sp. MBT65]MBK3578918.1 D-alanyl-D-alanine carboxypeptidase/D-alanyl-D-alanine-endopeptidase [Streptomyces sp. MBT65]